MVDEQLELFELTHKTKPSTRNVGSLERVQLRPDQAVLLTMVGLIGVAVVFALGIERGKQLVRSERLLEIPKATPSGVTSGSQTPSPRAETPSATPQDAPTSPSDRKAAPQQTPKGPSKTVASRLRFAIQVVSYSQPKLAQQELQRLKARGEPAFLMMKQGRAVLFVGPFPTKANASARLSSLKRRYQDCFVRSL